MQTSIGYVAYLARAWLNEIRCSYPNLCPAHCKGDFTIWMLCLYTASLDTARMSCHRERDSQVNPNFNGSMPRFNVAMAAWSMSPSRTGECHHSQGDPSRKVLGLNVRSCFGALGTPSGPKTRFKCSSGEQRSGDIPRRWKIHGKSGFQVISWKGFFTPRWKDSFKEGDRDLEKEIIIRGPVAAQILAGGTTLPKKEGTTFANCFKNATHERQAPHERLGVTTGLWEQPELFAHVHQP